MKLSQSLVFKRSIQFDEIDAGGVLYHANYIKICDQVRNFYYSEMGFDFFKQKDLDLALAIVDCSARYMRFVQMQDIYVVTRLVAGTRKTLKVKHVFCRSAPSPEQLIEAGDKLESLAETFFMAEFTLLGMSYQAAKSREIPAELLKLLGCAV